MNCGLAIALASVETRTIHKVRIRIIPFLFLLYIVAYLDRINIGFAALTMNKSAKALLFLLTKQKHSASFVPAFAPFSPTLSRRLFFCNSNSGLIET
ncbi:MAG TPA: hypothetical protein VKB49_23830 [Candidatus Sulfotelmatobacter sp.]|nr:hypothetical protein [Candidatus Sulfotelmatobacter sp.]